jgi:AAA family ATP:ADP antiporter
MGALLTSFLSFALLLACYYILRPVRDALAATVGADSIKYLSTAVFVAMLLIVPVFGWLAVRVPRPRLVPGLYAFFILNLGVFAVAFSHYRDAAAALDWLARAFYVWVTVFNMFAVSVFWSRMADVWSEPQGRRYFGVISAGGSLGGLAGPLLARTLAAHIAISGLVWISTALLSGALVGLSLLARRPAAESARAVPATGVDSAGAVSSTATDSAAAVSATSADSTRAIPATGDDSAPAVSATTPDSAPAVPATVADSAPAATATAAEPTGGAVLEGLWLIGRTPFLAGIAALVCLSSFLGMIVYIEMARLVAATLPSAVERTAFYSTRDLWVNAGAFLLQFFLLGQVARRLGVGPALVTASCVAFAAFVLLGLDPTLAVLTAVSVTLRCAEFGLAKPARDMLYTVVPPAAKYQSKNAIDTVVYRGSDMASGWIQSLIGRLGVGLGDWGWIAAACSVAFAAAAALVGRGYRRRGGR